jgi:oligopeptide transport system substrate-binding protein
MFSKKIVALVLLAMLMPLIAACGGTTATDTPQAAAPTDTAVVAAPTTAPTTAPAAAATNTTAPSTGGTSSNVFTWRAYAEPETFDPALMQENLSIDIGQNLYDGLTEFDVNTLAVKPNIATTWDTSPDGAVYTFHLNPAAKFTNGDPITADDFKYSWNRVLSNPKAPYAYVMDDIKGAKDVEASAASTDTTKTKLTEASGIVVKDPQTLVVTLNGPSAYFLSQTALWTYYVVNKKVVSTCPADKPSCFTETGKHTGAGSGPYIINTWNHGQNIKLTANKSYWRTDQVPAVDAEVPIVTDTSTAQAQFENGQLSVLDQPDAKDIKRIQADAKLGPLLHKTGYARTVWIGLNVKKGPFSPLTDTKAMDLRQAVAMGIDRQQLIDLALQGTADPVTTLLAKGVPGYQDFTAYKFDPAAAKQKLADAGHPNCQGLDLTYTFRQRDAEQAVATQLQTQFKDNLGCNIKVQGVVWKDMLAARQAHQYDMFYGSWGQDYPDPQDWLYALFDSRQIDVGNDPAYNNPAFDKLVEQANGMASQSQQADRIKLYNQAEQMLLKDAPLVPLYQPVRYYEVSPNWTGYTTNAQFAGYFRLVKPAK